uniref:Putative secreted protein n=1 Tax=Anopheles marajoara TaxID=58244 RepID=A0A2M4CE43_9DIPT
MLTTRQRFRCWTLLDILIRNDFLFVRACSHWLGFEERVAKPIDDKTARASLPQKKYAGQLTSRAFSRPNRPC